MKHPIVNTSLIAALLSVIAKMVYHIFLAPDKQFDMYTRFFYLFCFLAALFFGLRSWKSQHPGTPFTEDVKAGMKIASIFALVVSAFTWLYYAQINPEYFTGMIDERVAAAEKVGESAEVIANVRNTASFIFSPFIHATITLFGFMVAGFFYTLVLTLLFRAKPKAFGI